MSSATAFVELHDLLDISIDDVDLDASEFLNLLIGHEDVRSSGRG